MNEPVYVAIVALLLVALIALWFKAGAAQDSASRAHERLGDADLLGTATRLRLLGLKLGHKWHAASASWMPTGANASPPKPKRATKKKARAR